MAKKKKYIPRKNYSVSKDEAQVIGETIETLSEKTPEEFYKATFKEGHRLYHKYTKDDGDAAYKRRLDEARYMMRSIEVEIKYIDSPVKAYHAVRFEESDEVEYKSHDIVVKSMPDKEYLSEQFYMAVVAECDKAEGLGLHETDIAWKRIIKAVRKNQPESVGGPDGLRQAG